MYKADTGIPIAKRKVMILFFIINPPVLNSLYRTIMGALTTNDTIMETNLSLFLPYLHRLHGTGASAFATANAFLLIHIHASHKG